MTTDTKIISHQNRRIASMQNKIDALQAELDALKQVKEPCSECNWQTSTVLQATDGESLFIKVGEKFVKAAYCYNCGRKLI